MVERLGDMRKGGRERIEKGSRERIEKETKQQYRVRPCDVAIVPSSPQGKTCWSTSINFYKLIECIIKKISLM